MKRKQLFVTLSVLVSLFSSVALTTASSAGSAASTHNTAYYPAGVQLASMVMGSSPLIPVSSGFTYQGRLVMGGSPASGSFDFTFTLYDALSGGNQVGSTVTVLSQTLSIGTFSVVLDFGANAFQGDARWLQIGVRPSGTPTFTILSPRQALTPAPMALTLRPGTVISATLASPLVTANNTGSGTGLYGASNTGYGGQFISTAGTGILSSGGTGVEGISTVANGAGLWGISNTGSGASGVYGLSASGYGVYGVSAALDGPGIYGVANSGAAASGVRGESSSGKGVYGSSTALNSTGTYGVDNNGTTAAGVRGESSSGYGVFGFTTASDSTGTFGGSSGASGIGVRGNDLFAIGVMGQGGPYGVYGTAAAANGIGTYGIANYGSTASGVRGDSTSGVGVYGTATSGYGGKFTSTSGTGLLASGNNGIYSTGAANNGVGLWGVANTGLGAIGVYGQTANGIGVSGVASNDGWGVDGETIGGTGVYGASTTGTAIFGYTSTGLAGEFDGNVVVNGNCCAMGQAYTRIDDPLDPANKFLNQSLVQSPDMLSIINGNVTLDSRGQATVQIPAWFDGSNSDFRYELTPIGAPGPNLYIAQELAKGSFKIAGGAGGGKVSWQVTGVRNDAYAGAHPLQVEQAKPADEQGKYLHPQEQGQPESSGIDFDKSQRNENKHQPPSVGGN